jgi:Family of unknown function (DUF6190)
MILLNTLEVEFTELIDSSLFLGMHSENEEIRIACKNYFIERLQISIGMSLEHVGGCDNIIWLYPSKVQDDYYPFMDLLHTVMKISRLPYTEDIIRIALADLSLKSLSMYDSLLIAFAKSAKKVIYSINNHLLARKDLPIFKPSLSPEKEFPETLEILYQNSLKLRIPDFHSMSTYYS